MEISGKEAPTASLDKLHEISKKDQDSFTSLSLKIQDKLFSRQDLRKYRMHTKVFDVVFPDNAIFGVTKGKTMAVADGYYVITEPLAKGTYDVAYKANLICQARIVCNLILPRIYIYTILVK
jgi:hypothetical protein